jgi:hypothetical protein
MKRILNKLKTGLAEAVGWLTLHKRCSWCNRWTHVAPLSCLVRNREDWTSHGICPECNQKWLEDLG